MTRRNTTLLPTTNKLFPVWPTKSNPAFIVLYASCKSLLQTQHIWFHTYKCRAAISGICPTSIIPPNSKRHVWSLYFHYTNRAKKLSKILTLLFRKITHWELVYGPTHHHDISLDLIWKQWHAVNVIGLLKPNNDDSNVRFWYTEWGKGWKQ